MCFSGRLSHGTSISVIATPRKIVMAVDGKTIQVDAGKAVALHGRVSPKFVLLRRRIAVSSFGVAKIGSDPAPAFYLGDFYHGLKREVRKKSTATDVANIIARQAATAFSRVDVLGSTFTREILVHDTGHDNPLTAFVVAGYEYGQAKVFLIKVNVDWTAVRFTTPEVTLLYPDASHPNFDTFSSEVERASAGIEWVKCRVPETGEPSKRIEPTARAWVDFGIETRGQDVGLPITTITLSPDGRFAIHRFRSRMQSVCERSQPDLISR
jgi:hypothetical protein